VSAMPFPSFILVPCLSFVHAPYILEVNPYTFIVWNLQFTSNSACYSNVTELQKPCSRSFT
jgi:hypothetical protein